MKCWPSNVPSPEIGHGCSRGNCLGDRLERPYVFAIPESHQGGVAAVQAMNLHASSTSQQTTLPRLALVVIDDDERVRRSLGRVLNSYGYVVRLFESAEAYLDDQHDADCVIVDIGLPGISGLELEQRMRRRGLRTPVVFMTACDEASLFAAIEQTQRCYLRKPFEDRRLLETIARAIDDRR
jgi:CheY-like chemotaxis protein